MVTAVPGTSRLEELPELLKLVLARREHENTRIEDVGPTNVGNGSKFVRKREEMRHGSHREDVRIEEDYLRVLSKPEYMQFREDMIKVRTTWRENKRLAEVQA